MPALSWAQSPAQAPPGALSPVGASPASVSNAVPDPSRLSEVVVTARREKENLQDVPLSVTTFSATQLADQGLTSLSDIARLTPGLNYTPYVTAGYPVITIRGLAQRAITNLEENVSTFYGGIYLPRGYLVDTGFGGIDRVEVVEGPQSALYGRNAFAGAINYVPIAPPTRLTGDLFSTVGNDGRLDYGGSVGAPLIAGKLSAIAGYGHSEFDGTWANPHPNADAKDNGTTGNMGGYSNNTYFAALAFTPVDRLKVDVNWERVQKNVEAAGTYEFDNQIPGGTGPSTNCDPIGGVNQFYCGKLPVRQPIVDPRSQGLISRSDLYRVNVNYKLTDQLSIDYLYGRIDSMAYSFDQISINSVTGDIPGANLIEFLGLPVDSDNSNSNEIRVNYENGPTKISFGGSTSTVYDLTQVSLAFLPALDTTPIYPSSPGAFPVGDEVTHIDTNSAYAQVSQDFLDRRLNIELEGRYTSEYKRGDDLLESVEQKARFDYFTPRVAAKWNFTKQNNVYVSAARGAKSGGFNGGDIEPNERTYSPETNWTYELGTKNQFFGRRLQLDGDVFYVDWSNLQTVATSANPAFVGTITRNIGSVTDYGLEVNGLAKLFGGLTASTAFTFANPTYNKGAVDPRYTQGLTASGAPTLICNGITCPANGSIAGNQLAVESKYQATFGLHYDGNLELRELIHYSVGGDIDYKSRQYVDPVLLTYVPATTLVNLNGLLSYKNYEIDFFAKNLFNLKYASSAVYTLMPTDLRYEVGLGDLRTYGMTVRVKY